MKIIKYLVKYGEKSTAYLNMWDVCKAKFRGQCVVKYIYQKTRMLKNK